MTIYTYRHRVLKKGRARGGKEDHNTNGVLNKIQKVPETVIHLKVDKEQLSASTKEG